jgi:Zn-dependent protease with chaperone function
MKRANHATAHLFIANPFGQEAKKSWSSLWSTHPPVEERVKKLRGTE